MKRVFAALLALMLLTAGAAEGSVRELASYLGEDIAEAAKAIGGLTRSTSDEFSDNYSDDHLALHGNGGKVTFIELKGKPSKCALVGICVGMDRKSADDLLANLPKLWDFDVEVAYAVDADTEGLKKAMFILFYEEDKVASAWYRCDT